MTATRFELAGRGLFIAAAAAAVGIPVYLAATAHLRYMRTWGVCVMGLPDKVTASQGDQDVPHYILKQTHEPLLRKDDGQNYSSKLLSSWSRSIDSSRYKFCPREGLTFDREHPFTTEFLGAHLSAITAKYSGEYSVVSDGGCVDVDFKHGRRGYMDFLTRYENSPTVKISESVELGLGEYKVESVEKSRILLGRKEFRRDGYNRIAVYEASMEPQDDFSRGDISDFNRISWKEIPENVSRRFISFENIPLKTGVLVLTSPDRKLREAIYNCLNISQFRAAAFPHKKKFNDISTILPVGVPGGLAGKPEQVCSAVPRQEGRTAVLGTLVRNKGGRLEELFAQFYKATGIKVAVKYYSAQDLVATLYSRPHPYDMVAISFSVVQPEYETFFKDFVAKNGFVDYDLPDVSALLEDLRRSDAEQEKSSIAGRIAAVLRAKAVLLPLYQDVKTFYYPAEIHNMTVGRGFTEYPEVADFKW